VKNKRGLVVIALGISAGFSACGGGSGVSAFCRDVKGFDFNATLARVARDPSHAAEMLRTALAQLEHLQTEQPSSLKTDLATVHDIGVRAVAALATVRPGDTNGAVAALLPLSGELNRLTAALTHVNAYLTTTCHLPPVTAPVSTRQAPVTSAP